MSRVISGLLLNHWARYEAETVNRKQSVLKIHFGQDQQTIKILGLLQRIFGSKANFEAIPVVPEVDIEASLDKPLPLSHRVFLFEKKKEPHDTFTVGFIHETNNVKRATFITVEIGEKQLLSATCIQKTGVATGKSQTSGNLETVVNEESDFKILKDNLTASVQQESQAIKGKVIESDLPMPDGIKSIIGEYASLAF